MTWEFDQNWSCEGGQFGDVIAPLGFAGQETVDQQQWRILRGRGGLAI